MAKKSNAAKIRAYMTANPDAKPAEVAEKFKASVTYVYVLRSQMKTAATKKNEKKWETVHISTSNEPLPTPAAPVALDMVNHPVHYKVGGIETIDFIEAKGLNYHLGNVVKYVTRADHKGERLENLKKAKWYLDREIAQSAQ